MSTREMQIAHKGHISGSHQEGSALIAAVLFLVVSTAVAAGIAALASSASETSADLLDSERAFYAAESAKLMSGSLPRNKGENKEDYRVDIGENVFGAYVGKDDDDRFIAPKTASELCDSGEDSLYIGWVGGKKSSWEDANARHAICATLDPMDNLPGGWESIEHWKDYSGSGNVAILNGKAQGGGNVTVEEDYSTCIAEGAWSTGNVSFEGDVYLESGSLDSYFSGNAPDFGGCVYIGGKVADPEDAKHYDGCEKDPGEPTENEYWCGSLEDATGESWEYAGSSQ
ncbi:MAG: hypothetical protein ACLFSI_03710 [Halorhodospira sp.]